MNITLKELRTMSENLSKDIKYKEREIKANCTIVTHVMPESNSSEVMSREYDFDGEFACLEAMYSKQIAYERAIQKANATTLIEDKTVVDIIKEISILKKKYELLDSLNDRKESNYRRDVGNNGSFYYEKTTLRYLPKEIKDMRDNLRTEINRLETLLDKANTETVVAVKE